MDVPERCIRWYAPIAAKSVKFHLDPQKDDPSIVESAIKNIEGIDARKVVTWLDFLFSFRTTPNRYGCKRKREDGVVCLKIRDFQVGMKNIDVEWKLFRQ